MNAYIIAVGDELLIGQTINTNVSFIGEKLAEISVRVIKNSSIADDESEIINEFKNAWSNADLVIVTGGLGPTHDDITRNSVVRFFNTTLVKNEIILEDINALFQKRGRKVTAINEDQAMVPKIAEAIRNSRGTAPGMWIEKDQKFFIVMPGVPYEMEAMMENFVIPRLISLRHEGDLVTSRKVIQTTGIPESHLFERLGKIDELLNGAKLAFLPNQFGVKLRISAEGPDEKSVNEKINSIEQKIRAKAGRYIFGSGDELIEEVIGRILSERELTISTAESCTGGMIANMLTNVSGSSKYFERGVVCYSNASKVEILKVDEDSIQNFGAVSQEVAMQMAEGVKSTSGASIGISTTGIMGPTGATTGKPVGLVYIGYCDDKVCTAKKFTFGEDRILNKQRTAQAALDFVRRQVLGITPDE